MENTKNFDLFVQVLTVVEMKQTVPNQEDGRDKEAENGVSMPSPCVDEQITGMLSAGSGTYT